MAGELRGVVARHFQHLLDAGTAAGLGEPQLLDRFVRRGDDAAFAALVTRHGPTVRAVCLRVLRDAHAADDAFQATFLVLARRASTIRDPDRLGPWLHRVALRVAIRASDDARRRRESPDAEALASCPAPEPPGGDARPAIHEEVDRLPEKYRAPVVLCYLEGLSHEEAARRLRWPVGSVKGRLSRARGLLRDRLMRRGVVLPAGTIVALLAREARAVPVRLATSAVETALRSASGPSAAEIVSAPAVRLAQGVLSSMLWSRLIKASIAAAFATGLLLAGAGVLARPQPGEGQVRSPMRTGPGPLARADEPTSPHPPARDEKPSEEQAVELDRARVDVDLLELEVGALRDQLRDAMTLVRSLERSDSASIDDVSPEKADRILERRARDSVEAHKQVEMLRHEFQDKSLELGRRKRQAADLERRRAGEDPGPAIGGARATGPRPFRVGDRLRVEVLQALPGRPISGQRVVRADGTVGLDFYGDIPAAGLTRDQVKVKVIEHLRRFLPDETLGLVAADPKDSARSRRLSPAESTSVFVDEVWAEEPGRPRDSRTDALERKLDRILDELEDLRRNPRRP
jgi:RNA polymerase sigma factor (sigma-70 family)